MGTQIINCFVLHHQAEYYDDHRLWLKIPPTTPLGCSRGQETKVNLSFTHERLTYVET